MNQIFVKNSSSEVNFGDYKLDLQIRTDGGRIFTSKKYEATIEVDEVKNILKVTINEPKPNSKGHSEVTGEIQ